MSQIAQRAMPRRARAPSVVGWNGIYLEVPEDWNLAAVSGEMSQGFLRIDGPDELHVSVKWKEVRRKGNIERDVDRYLKLIEKKSRRSPAGFEVNRDIRLPLQKDAAKRKPLFFSWRTDIQGIGMIWHCPSCGRVVIAQVDGPVKRNLTLLASQVLGTLDDHAADGCHTWAVYGLAAEIPCDFVLTQNKLLSGYIQLQFARGRSSIILDRWGLADVALKNESLEDWIRSHYTKSWKNYRVQVEDAEIRGHQGLAVTGDLRAIRERVQAGALKLVRLQSPTQLTQFAWRCEETNRICSVLAQHSNKEKDLAEEIAASYVCHSR